MAKKLKKKKQTERVDRRGVFNHKRVGNKKYTITLKKSEKLVIKLVNETHVQRGYICGGKERAKTTSGDIMNYKGKSLEKRISEYGNVGEKNGRIPKS